MRRQFMVFIVSLFLAGCAGGSAEDTVDIGRDLAETVDAISCPDGLLLWEEYNVCAPPVDDCKNPWELPLIGGGCVAVGPRACPKLWDPAADLDCTPGELMQYDGMACPEGFVLTEDEAACVPFFEESCGGMEIPALGGGCSKVGPQWGEAGEPYFDECPDGHLALRGGGCVQVGPRACPKLWDPEADVDCEIGDVLPCPEGWGESEDGLYCEPIHEECPFGERPLLGGGCERVVPLAEDCPPGPFPNVPGGATDVVFVLAASDCAQNCGSQSAPFSSIQPAVDAVPEGGHVLVGQGNYPEGVSVGKPVHIIGICSAKVFLSGVTQVSTGQPSQIAFSTVSVTETDEVLLQGLSLQPPGCVGLAVVAAHGVEIRDFRIQDVAGTASYFAGGSYAVLEDVWIVGISPFATPETTALGLVIEAASSVLLSTALIEQVGGVGVFAAGDGTSVVIEDSTVRSVSVDATTMSVGVAIVTNANAQVRNSLVRDCETVGVTIEDGASLQLVHSQVTGAGPDTPIGQQYGVRVLAGGQAHLDGVAIAGNGAFGLFVSDPTSSAEVKGSLMTRNAQDPGSGAAAVTVTNGAGVVIFGSTIIDNHTAGLIVDTPGAFADVKGSRVTDSTSHSTAPASAAGIAVQGGATLVVDNSLVEGNEGFGIMARDDGTTSMITASGIVLTDLFSGGAPGAGVAVVEGAGAKLIDCYVERNSGYGLRVRGSGSVVEAVSTSVSGTTATEDTIGGLACLVMESAVFHASDSVFADNRGGGIGVSDHGSVALVGNSLVDCNSTLDDVDSYYRGLHAQDGATLEFVQGEVAGCRGVSVLAVSPGTEAVIEKSKVHSTTWHLDGSEGAGVAALDGALVELSECLLWDNPQAALVVAGEGARAAVTASVLDSLLPVGPEALGATAVAVDGGQLSVTSSLVRNANSVGLLAQEPGTHISVTTSEIIGLAADGDAVPVFGIEVTYGASGFVGASRVSGSGAVAIAVGGSGASLDVAGVVTGVWPSDSGAAAGGAVQVLTSGSMLLSGTLIDSAPTAGLVAQGQESSVLVRGTIVRGPLLDDIAIHGEGVIVLAGAHVDMLANLVAGNNTVGILVQGQVSTLVVAQSAVLNTEPGGAPTVDSPARPSEVFGDGILVIDEGEATISRTLVAGNGRCGIYFWEGVGSITNSVVTENNSYGFALEGTVVLGDSDGDGNFVFGNALSLPERRRADVAFTTKGLPVPMPPGCPASLHPPVD